MTSARFALSAPVAGRTVVVTGADSGIGLEAARGLVGRGVHVVLAVRDTASAEKVAACLVGPGSTSVVELTLLRWAAAAHLLEHAPLRWASQQRRRA